MKFPLSFRYVVIILIAIYLAWVATSPFPNPESVMGYTHSDMRHKLGVPDTEFPDKFNRWKKKRFFFEWIFETDSPMPLNLEAPVLAISVRLVFVSPVASISIYTDELNFRDV